MIIQNVYFMKTPNSFPLKTKFTFSWKKKKRKKVEHCTPPTVLTSVGDELAVPMQQSGELKSLLFFLQGFQGRSEEF